MNSHREITFRQALNEALYEELGRNSNLIVFGEDILDGHRQPIFQEIKNQFPHQMINHLPLTEEMLGNIGLGMNIGGLPAIIQLNYSTYIPLIFDSLYRLGTWRYRIGEKEGPSVLFLVGHDGYSGTGAEFACLMLSSVLHVPNISVVAPTFPYYAKGLLKTLLHSERPAIFLIYKNGGNLEQKGWVPKDEYTVPFKNSVTLRVGKDVTLVTWLYLNHHALAAARELENTGISTEIISLQTLHPLDTMTILNSARKTKRVVIIEEEMLRGGVGAEIGAQIVENLPFCHIARVATKNTALPVTTKYENLILPTKDDIVAACKKIVNVQYPKIWTLFGK